MLISDAAGAFITYARVDRMYAPETQLKIKDCFRAWLLPLFGAREVESLTALDVLELRRIMTDRALSVARQYSVVVFLKLFLKFCRVVLKLKVLDPTEVRLPRRTHNRVEYLTNQEADQLLNAVPMHTFNGLRLRTLMEVLLSTGMRISEALSLNRDVTETRPGEIAEVEITGKGSKQRTVFLSPRCLEWTKRFVAIRTDPHPALFVTTGTSPRRLGRNEMSKVFRKLGARAGITKKVTPHLLRHTFCTSLLHAGADITFIKELAGHQDIETTARYYLGVDKKALRQVLERCQIHGWQAPALLHTPDSDAKPVWPLAGPGLSSNGTSFPNARGPGSP
jgi:site-specific recombinase XerD